jgi:hypothetical protein
MDVRIHAIARVDAAGLSAKQPRKSGTFLGVHIEEGRSALEEKRESLRCQGVGEGVIEKSHSAKEDSGCGISNEELQLALAESGVTQLGTTSMRYLMIRSSGRGPRQVVHARIDLERDTLHAQCE